MKTYKFNKEDVIKCKMTTLYEVKSTSLGEAKALIVNGEGEQVGLMFTEADVLDEGGIKHAKNS